jgi:hypothetical protein
MSATSARPTGITILAILAGLSAIGALFSGFVAFGLGASVLGGAAALLGVAFLALGGLSLAVGWGFWSMQPWAWPAGVALAAANIVVTLFGVVFASTSITSAILPIVVSGVILYYLNQPTIKSLFARA